MPKRLLGFVGLRVLVIVGFLSLPISAAPQAVFTVTTTNDAGDGVCDAAHCSLREAINAANVSGAPGVINFNIIGFPPFVIQPTLSLPALAQNGI